MGNKYPFNGTEKKAVLSKNLQNKWFFRVIEIPIKEVGEEIKRKPRSSEINYYNSDLQTIIHFQGFAYPERRMCTLCTFSLKGARKNVPCSLRDI